jgi:uncharacterized protein YhhL (DUF1145 family)
LIFVIIIGVIFWAVRVLSSAFGIPQPIQTVIMVLLVVICLIYILQALGGSGGFPPLRFR